MQKLQAFENVQIDSYEPKSDLIHLIDKKWLEQGLRPDMFVEVDQDSEEEEAYREPCQPDGPKEEQLSGAKVPSESLGLTSLAYAFYLTPGYTGD